MEFERLADFVAVASEKSFSKAAAKRYKTQPAVSQSIALLEKAVGQPLFLRLRRRVELTQAGEVLLQHARSAFAALEEAKAEISGLESLEAGVVRIGASDTTTCYVLPRVLKRFRTRYPGIEIVISNRTSPVVVRQVVAGEVELGIVTLPASHPLLEVSELISREDVLICPPGHALGHRKRVTLKEVAAFPLLLLDKGSATRAFIDRQFQSAHLPQTIAMELGSIEVIKTMVQLGFGVSIVPLAAVRAEVKRNEICAVRVFSAKETRKLGAVYMRGRYLSPAARAFLEMLAAFTDGAKRGSSPRRR